MVPGRVSGPNGPIRKTTAMNTDTSISATPFYTAYQRQGQGTRLKRKHIRQYSPDFMAASGGQPGMSVLELGCGNGLFLRFLDQAGLRDVQGVDGDPRVLDEIPHGLRARVTIADFDRFFAQTSGRRQFDRIALFDVLEHFDPADATELLRGSRALLAPGGKVVVRVPNMGSPFGLGLQYKRRHPSQRLHRGLAGPGRPRRRTAGVALLPPGLCHPRPRVAGTGVTGGLSLFLAAPPRIWSPALIGVFSRGD